jgi:hypothetical protein
MEEVVRLQLDLSSAFDPLCILQRDGSRSDRGVLEPEQAPWLWASHLVRFPCINLTTPRRITTHAIPREPIADKRGREIERHDHEESIAHRPITRRARGRDNRRAGSFERLRRSEPLTWGLESREWAGSPI